jgi:hypothetical protein
MAMKTSLRIAAWSSAGLALFTAGLALGQHTAPTDYKGVTESVLAAIDLAKEIDNVENRELRVSRAIVAPGGHIGLHSHQGDPTIVYVLDGVLTNHHETVAGLRKMRHRGLLKVDWQFTLAMAAYDLVRLPKLLTEVVP